MFLPTVVEATHIQFVVIIPVKLTAIITNVVNGILLMVVFVVQNLVV
jgi:hypothetical protein